MDSQFVAIVARSTGSWYEVWPEEGGSDSGVGGVLKARIRGKLRLSGSRSTNPVVVGDRVECTWDEGGEVWIERVLPRTNYIIRRSSNLSRESHIIAANVDRALVVATISSPVTSVEFIDRFLVTCEAYDARAAIALNKIDIARASEKGRRAMERFTEIYTDAGYRVIPTCAISGEGLRELRDWLRGHTTLVSGNSGVGKSTLIRSLVPGVDIRVGEISRAHGKGMHTTTFSQMYPLPDGGDIIDSPGIKGFGLIDIAPAELARYLPDFARVAPRCAYHNCTHTHEPDCAVVEAVQKGEIAPERYESYLKMLEENSKYRS